jgi:hypothetical protein
LVTCVPASSGCVPVLNGGRLLVGALSVKQMLGSTRLRFGR